MAVTSGEVVTNTLWDSYFWVKWSQSSQSIQDNSTTISWSCGMTTSHHFYSNAVKMYSVVINGTTVYSGGTYSNLSGTTTFSSGTLTIPHSSDGTKTFTVSAFSGWLYDTGTCSSSATNFTLTTIPRASSITCTTSNIGSDAIISISRASSSFTHSLYYMLSSTDTLHWVKDKDGNNADKIAGTSFSWRIPTDFYANIPDKKYISGILVCKTFSGSTQIGSDTRITFVANVDETTNKPTITKTLQIDTRTKSLTGASSVSNFTTFINNYTTLTYSITASAKNSSTISSIAVSCGSTSQSGSYSGVSSATYNNSFTTQSGTINIVVKDSRGFSYTETITKNLIPYIGMSCSISVPTFTVQGANLVINGTCFTGSFGAKTNSIYLYYAVKESGSEIVESDWARVTPTLGEMSYSANINIANLDYQKTYIFKARVRDLVYTSTYTESNEVVKSSVPVFDWDKDDFAFHVPVNVDGDLNVKSGAIELNNDGSLSNYGGYIDFHFDKSNEDYTSRIIEDSSGHIDIQTPNGLSIAGNVLFENGEQTDERVVRFKNTNGTNTHNCSLYGGNPNSDTGIGLWDTKHNRRILAFLDNNNDLKLGNDSCYITSERRLRTLAVSSGAYMNASQTITLSDSVSNQLNGIVVAWSYYSSSSGTGLDYDWNYTFIPKEHILRHSGAGIDCPLMMYVNGTFTPTVKYIYVSNTTISGNDYNSTGNAKLFVLRYVYGV